MEQKFETEVLTRLAVIESKLDDYKSIKDKSESAYNLSNNNKKEIEEIQEKLKWLSRTITGALITGVIGIVFLIIRIGIGIN